MSTLGQHDPVPLEDEENKENVFCNVYDILPRLNSVARTFGSNWGIYHTGVQVQGLEFAFGGHSGSSTGVFCARPRSAQGAIFREQVPIGRVTLDPLELRQVVAEVSQKWPGNLYDPLDRNCNHFSDFLCRELAGQGAPPYVNRFSKSRFVRVVFYRCLVPLGRCLERFYVPPAITYGDDASISSEVGAGEELGITGARGINQVLLEAATMQKAKANKAFKDGDIESARTSYGKALRYLSSMSRRAVEEEETCIQAEAVQRALALNLAACDLKAEDYESCVDRCTEVLVAEPADQKALYRRGIALSHLGSHHEALSDLRSVLQLANKEEDAATVRDVRREIDRVRKVLEGDKEKDREFAKRMFGGGQRQQSNANE